MLKTYLKHLTNKYQLSLLLAVFLFGSYEVQANMNKSSFKCELTLPVEQKLSEGIYITFSVLNNTSEEYSLLTWYTPFEGFMSNLFIIEDNQGNKVEYQGPMVKRSSPLLEDYIAIPAGKKKLITLDLTQVYQLTKGDFNLKLNRQGFKVANVHGEIVSYDFKIEEIKLKVN